MPCNYVLIDLENVQPENLEKLAGHSVQVYVFVGHTQAKLPFEFVAAMQKLGDCAHYVKMSGSGHNSLDFHIAFYIGELSSADPAGHFHIVSGDTGFDPLIDHLRKIRAKKLRIYRIDDIEKLAFLRASCIGTVKDRMESLVENLKKRGPHLPKKSASLEALIHAHFGKKLLEHEVQHMIAALQKKKLLTITDGLVEYHLPGTTATDTIRIHVASS